MKNSQIILWWWWQTRKPPNRWPTTSLSSSETTRLSSQAGAIILFICKIWKKVVPLCLNFCFFIFRLQGVLEKLRSVAAGKLGCVEYIPALFNQEWEVCLFNEHVRLRSLALLVLLGFSRARIPQAAAVRRRYCEREEPIVYRWKRPSGGIKRR